MPIAKRSPNIPLPQPPVETMAAILSTSDVDLGDERACIRCLNACDIPAGEILSGLDAAIERARALRATADIEVA